MLRLPVGFSAVAVVLFSRNSQQHVWSLVAPTRLCNDVTRESRSPALSLWISQPPRCGRYTPHTCRAWWKTLRIQPQFPESVTLYHTIPPKTHKSTVYTVTQP